MTKTTYHKPILLNETIEGLNINPEGVYVDMTFGGGGHSKEILSKLNAKGRLVGFDQDADAIQNALDDSRVTMLRSNFQHAARFLRLIDVAKVDGVMADLGVSSHQFDEAERGFSYRFNAVLDMRMSQEQKLTAVDVLNDYSERDLLQIFSSYGEIRNSRQLARVIVDKRRVAAIRTGVELEKAIEKIIKGDKNRYFAQLYQSIRMEVNDEMGALKKMLESTSGILREGGRLVVISFHSIEDRVVKRFVKTGNTEGKADKDAFGVIRKPFKEVVKGVIVPGELEQKENPRSKSAKLRIAERI